MKRVIFLLSLILIVTFQSCKKEDSPTEPEEETNTGSIKTGTTINLTNQTIGTAGGNIKISKPSDPLNGLELSIPANAFSQNQTVNISYADVKGHEFGEYFNPISPLIEIKLNQSFSLKPMQLKIPIKLPAGHHAMAFLYNKNTGELEGLPTEDLTSSYILINSAHFSYSTLGKRADEITDASNQVIVASTLETLTSGNLQISAGFDVGVDDWEFPNWGSYIAPGGHCAGQSVSAIWYYAEKRTSLGRLFHKYDKLNDSSDPNNFWWDNPKGFRLSSVIQNDMNFGNWWSNWIDKINKQMEKPGLIWKNIFIALVVKRQPQLLFIRNTEKGWAHAIICYKIDLSEKMLYIADPNFPNTKIQRMSYSDSWIGPYISRNNAGTPNISFNQFGYFQISQYIELKKIRERWKEFEAGTIGQSGTVGKDKFPTYKLTIGNSGGAEVADGMTVTKSSFDVVCKSTECDSSFAGTDNLQPIEFYDEQGTPYGVSDNKGVANYILNKGSNKLGILVYGLKKGYGRKFIDFKWVTINYTPEAATLSIDPGSLDAALNGTYDFKAVYTGVALPSKYICYWYFPGETSYKTKTNDMTMRYQFKKEGNFTVTCDVYDITTGVSTKLGNASASVKVSKKPLSDLYGLDGLYLQLTGECEYNNSTSNSFNYTVMDYTIYGQNKLLWMGNNFSVEYKYPKLGVVVGDTTYVTGTISGKVMDDGKSITTVTINENGVNNRTPHKYSFSITVQNFSLTRVDAPGFYTIRGQAKGAEVGARVTALSYSGTFSNYPDPGWKDISFKSFNYSSTKLIAELFINFQ